MKVKVTIVTTGYDGDRAHETMVLVFANEETEAEMAEAMWESYCMVDEGAAPTTLEGVYNELGDIWFEVDEREIEVKGRKEES